MMGLQPRRELIGIKSRAEVFPLLGKLIFKLLAEQTGLTATTAMRKVKVLFVEKAD